MSVVAVKVYMDKIVVAADSIRVRYESQEKNSTKLQQHDNLIIGGVGSSEENALMHLYSRNHKPGYSTETSIIEFLAEFQAWKNTKTSKNDLTNNFIIVHEGLVWRTESYCVSQILTHTAIGAGMDFANTALHLGKSPQEAVQVACELSIYCEAPVISYEWHAPVNI